MSLSEFSIIDRFFRDATEKHKDVIHGIGDDGAVMRLPVGMDLVVVMDTLVADIHFFKDCSPDNIAYKSLAVNLSDIAAMGAQPRWLTLSLTSPELNESWLQAFSHGIASLANEYGVQLVGGDLSRGPLSVTVQMHGLIPQGQAILRSGALVGDHIFVTGRLGDAGLALQLMQSDSFNSNSESHVYLQQRLQRPDVRIEAGLALRQIASSMIDVSDGLVADLGHILHASEVGATLNVEDLPLSPAYRSSVGDLFTEADIYQLALSAGDDYELCFTVPEARLGALQQCFKGLPIDYHQVGIIEAGDQLRLLNQGDDYALKTPGFQHF